MQPFVHPIDCRPAVHLGVGRWISLAAALVILSFGGAWTDSHAAGSVRYEPVMEWVGPRYAPLHSAPTWLPVDDPEVDIEFQQPRSVVAREHSGRDVVYVLDSGNRRIQVFEVNSTFFELSQEDLIFSGGTPTAGEYSATLLRTPEWAATTTQWVVPGSEAVSAAGQSWRRVDDLTGFTATDRVYKIDYASPTNQPQFEFPASTFASTSIFAVRYLVSDLQDTGGGTPEFGLGDIDYGIRNGNMTPIPVQIDESSGGPTEFDELRGLALLPGVATATTDHLFVIDSQDQSSLQNEKLFTYTVDLAGTITAGEAYDDDLDGPYDVTAIDLGTGAGSSAWLDADTGPFDKASYPFISDASQVTGHSYEVVVATGVVTITDQQNGRILVNTGAEANFADPCLVVPGLSLPLNGPGWGDGTTVITTSKAYPERFVFVADTENDRIKVIGIPSGVTASGSNWTGDWLPSDPRTVVTQPAAVGTIGAVAGDDYTRQTPSTVPEDWVTWTLTSPIAENTLSRINFIPAGTDPQVWIRIDDLATASPTDSVFQVDWTDGQIRFGDGIHGAIPPSNIDFTYNYSSTPDVVRYGTSGTGDGRFASPRGVAARWNSSLARVDLYVSDSANQRIQKLSFQPADTLLGTDPDMSHVITWKDLPSEAPIRYPAGLQVNETSGGTVLLAVCDPANHRVVVLEDTHAADPIPGLPTLAASLGRSGNRLGNFIDPVGATFLPNGLGLDLYVADQSRDVITKYEESPSPTITLLYTGDSALPNCFPPQAGYHIRFSTTHTPFSGFVDFYYDTKDEFDESTAKLALPVESVTAVSGEAFWDFSETPDGPPPDGDYYLFARLKDSPGSTIATDQTTGSFLICIDSSLNPALMARDAIDHDPTLYLQNGLERVVDLQVVFPESLTAVSFAGAYDPSLVEILEITPGTGWDGTGFTERVFTTNVDSIAGVYTVFTSVTGAPAGLNGSGPFALAHLQVRARTNALSATDRFRDGIIGVDPTLSSMTNIHGDEPTQWDTQALNVRVAYLGDIATTGAGADSIVPNLQPRPDGKIDFDDQLAFTLGWNGLNSVRDRIADMGPSTGSSPDLWPVPDDRWNVDDLLVFTSQASYFNSAGWNATTPEAFTTPAASLVATWKSPVEANPTDVITKDSRVSVSGNLVSPTQFQVGISLAQIQSLAGARLRIDTPDGWSVIRFEASSEFALGAQLLQIDRAGPSWFESGLTRMATNDRGAEIDGVLGYFTLESDGSSSPTAQTSWVTVELRDLTGEIVTAHTEEIAFEDSQSPDRPTSLYLAVPSPNPVRGSGDVRFALPHPGPVRVEIYGVDGRRVRGLVNGALDAGSHSVAWDGKNDRGRSVSSGIYFYVLETDRSALRQGVVFLR